MADDPDTPAGDESDDTTVTGETPPAATVNDPSGNKRDWVQEKNRIAKHKPVADGKELREWALGFNGKYSNREGKAKRTRIFSDRSMQLLGVPLVEMDKADYDEVIDSLEMGTHPYWQVPDDGYSHDYLRNIEMSTRMFFRDHLERDWAKDIDPRPPADTKVKEDDVFSREEAADLLDAATNPRDVALAALLLTTGQRISAALSLRVGDVENIHDPQAGAVTLNEEAVGLKDMDDGLRLFLTWAEPYVKNWLAVHPDRNDSDTPLFCTFQSGKHHDAGDVLGPTQAGRRLKMLAEDAGIEKNVYPHMFRHTAITWMYVSPNWEEKDIRHVVGWGKDSTQFDRYAHLTNAEHEASIVENLGLKVDDATTARPTMDDCPGCQSNVLDGAHYCPGCGLALDHSATNPAEQVDALADAVGEGVALTDDRELRIGKRVIEQVLTHDDDLRAELAAEFATAADARSEAETGSD